MRARFLVLLLVLSGLVGCDHATKHWAEHELARGAPVQLVDRVLELRYAQNDDVAFSLLRSVPRDVRMPIILASAAFAIAIVSVMLLRRSASPPLVERRLELAALALVLAGAVGNLADRLARGYVVDFIHLSHWPVFNLADVWITVGALLLLLSARRSWRAATRA